MSANVKRKCSQLLGNVLDSKRLHIYCNIIYVSNNCAVSGIKISQSYKKLHLRDQPVDGHITAEICSLLYFTNKSCVPAVLVIL